MPCAFSGILFSVKRRMVNPLPSRFAIKAGPPALIFVIVEWCHFCSELKPRIPEFEAILGGAVPVYTVDGDQSPKKVKDFEVDGFPTILYKTSAGKLYKYNGPREPRAIKKFIATYDPSVL